MNKFIFTSNGSETEFEIFSVSEIKVTTDSHSQFGSDLNEKSILLEFQTVRSLPAIKGIGVRASIITPNRNYLLDEIEIQDSESNERFSYRATSSHYEEKP